MCIRDRDAVLGIEYTVRDLPITVSLDLTPRITFSTAGFIKFEPWFAGLTARYTLK